MLRFDFVVADKEAETGVVGGFTYGFVVVSGDGGTHPDLATAKTTWLVPFVQDLLYDLLILLQTPTQKQCSVRAVNSDYGVKFFQNRHGIISVYGLGRKETLLGSMSQSELRRAVWAATRRFYPAYDAFHRLRASAETNVNDWDWAIEADIRTEFDALCQKWQDAFPDLPLLIAE